MKIDPRLLFMQVLVSRLIYVGVLSAGAVIKPSSSNVVGE